MPQPGPVGPKDDITMRNAGIIVLFTSLMLVSSAALPADESAEPIGPKLPDRVRGLLIQEMNAILEASKMILDGIVRGQHEQVADRARAIHDSFILEQEMTEADRRALMEAVPEAFVARDRAFHELTAELAEAARARDSDRQRVLFGEMLEACTACHARHAGNRFPGLEPAP